MADANGRNSVPPLPPLPQIDENESQHPEQHFPTVGFSIATGVSERATTIARANNIGLGTWCSADIGAGIPTINKARRGEECDKSWAVKGDNESSGTQKLNRHIEHDTSICLRQQASSLDVNCNREGGVGGKEEEGVVIGGWLQ